MSMPFFRVLLFSILVVYSMGGGGSAQAQPWSVLWVNGMPEYRPNYMEGHRRGMAQWVGQYEGGAVFNVSYQWVRRGGGLAAALAQGDFDIVVIDVAEERNPFNTADQSALQSFFSSGRSNLMLDGSMTIRSSGSNQTTVFPGVNGSSGALTANQLVALGRAGGGILIGTDHNSFQVSANYMLRAILPQARFSGLTNPSTDGDFIGTTLLAEVEQVRAIDILRHWETIPSQGEAPVGDFVAFNGQPMRLYSLVEAADKNGNRRKRPYISASFDPGENRTAIDSEQPIEDNLPTRKSP